MRRRFLATLAAISLLGSVLSVVLWIRTYFASDWILRSHRSGDKQIGDFQWTRFQSGQGWIVIDDLLLQRKGIGPVEDPLKAVEFGARYFHRRDLPAAPDVDTSWYGLSEPPDHPIELHAIGVGVAFGEYKSTWPGQRERYFGVAIPIWAIFLISALPPAVWIYLFHRRKRQILGLCVKCGYLLTGNISGVCPECGAQIKAEQLAFIAKKHPGRLTDPGVRIHFN
jgi:hypothetical protein